MIVAAVEQAKNELSNPPGKLVKILRLRFVLS